jgi:hypothetical protein
VVGDVVGGDGLEGARPDVEDELRDPDAGRLQSSKSCRA